jgi:hypothetical protein
MRDLELKQAFQKFEGAGVTEGKLVGERIGFTLADADGTPWVYSGRVRAKSMSGTARAPGKADVKWTAKRG